MIIGNINGALLLILASVYLVNSNKKDVVKTKVLPKSEISIFSDVIKNISRVNNVLHELIQNYEQLQKISKVKSLESDYITDDDEIDEGFKEKRRKKKEAKRTSKKTAFPATQMIVSEEQQKSSNTESANEGEVLSNGQQIQKENIMNKPNAVPHTNATHGNAIKTVKDLNKYGLQFINDKNEINRTIKQNKIKKKRISIKLDNRKAIGGKNKGKRRNKFDRVAAALSRRVTREKINITKPSKTPIRITQATTGIVKHEKKRKKVRKVVYSESFAEGNIWKDIAEEKPIRLKANPPILSKRGNIESDQFHYHHKNRQQPKTALIIVTKNQKKKVKENPKESDSIQDERDLDKEEFKANVLRQAYGDACLKVVIKKCHKACKAVLKQACSSLRCKSEFKENYINNAKTKCIKQFQHNGSDATDTSTKNPPEKPKKQAKRLPSRELFVIPGYTEPPVSRVPKYKLKKGRFPVSVGPNFKDVTRTGFDFEACYPFMKPEIARNGTIDIANREDRQVNILRDRFEKACQKASTQKCSNACRETGHLSCEEFPCDKSLKKALRKRCPKQCKLMYRGEKTKKSKSSVYSSESSGSSDDSSGSSDSDSDDDDSD